MDSEKTELSFRHFAHDLKNIFSQTLLNVELLRRNKLTAKETAVILDRIKQSTKLCEDILNESISPVKLKTEFSDKININDLLNDLIWEIKNLSPNTIKVNLNSDENLKLITGRYVDFYRIFFNLLNNSLQAMHSDPVLNIKTSNSVFNNNEYIEVVIEDNGIGIKNENLGEIFKNNFSTKSSNSNSGLGLFIVKSLIEKYSGFLNVKSQYSIGTEFRVTLPIKRIVSKPVSDSSKTILVGDDEVVLCELLTELFNSYGFNVIYTHNGDEFLTALNNNKIDLMIIDKNMPVVNGLECLAEINRLELDTPVIFISGAGEIDFQKHFNERPIKYYPKPFDFEVLLKYVNKILL
jgi:CheY-like chemotaxis protein